METLKKKLLGSTGMTLVEFMVAIVITALLMILSTGIFMSQHKSYSVIQDANELQETMPTAMAILKQDLMESGWAVKPEMAFYFQDGGAGGSDKIYINDTNIISTDNDLKVLTDNKRTPCVGCLEMSGTNPYVLDTLNDIQTIDINKYKDGTSSDNKKDFYENYYQFIITDLTNLGAGNKIAIVTTTNAGNSSITLNQAVGGIFLTPAIYYCVDDGVDAACNPTNAAQDSGTTAQDWSEDWVLRRSDRDSQGRQALAQNVVDLQLAYQDDTGWHCDGVHSCPAGQFDPSKVQLIRLTLVMRSEHLVVPEGHTGYCRPGAENHLGTDLTDSNAVKAECGYRYRTYSVQVCSRNS